MSSPVVRPLAPNAASQTPRSGVDSLSITTPKYQRYSLPLMRPERQDHHPMTRVSSKALSDMQRMLSDQDRELLMFVQAVRLATGAQLRRLMHESGGEPESVARCARRRLQRLGQWRMLDRLPARSSGGTGGGSDSYRWFVGPAGRRLLERMGFVRRRLGAPSERFALHALGVTELVVRLIEADRREELELLSWEGEPACWRPFLAPGGGRVILKPDLALRLGAGPVFETRYFIEYDRASEAAGSLTTKLRRHVAYRASGNELAKHGADPKVLWLVPDETRANLVHRLVEQLPDHDRELFAVTTHEDALRFLAREASS